MTTRNLLPALPKPTGVLAKLLPGQTTTIPSGPEVDTVRVPRTERGQTNKMRMTELRGNLVYTSKDVTAYYTLAPVFWPFRSDAVREEVITASATQYAALAGRHVHVRRTAEPFPIDRWLREFAGNSRPLPDIGTHLSNDPAGERFLDLEQMDSAGVLPTWAQHLANARARLSEDAFIVHRTQIGVSFPLAGRRGHDKTLEQIAELTEQLSLPGLRAQPSTPGDMLWLLYRSVGIGLTPPAHLPGDLGPGDVVELTDAVDMTRTPYSSTTQLTNRHTGETVYATVLSVGRMEDLEIPQVNQPWSHLSAQLDYPVEWSSRLRILGPAMSRGELHRRLNMIRSQRRDYAEHGIEEPRELERLQNLAAQFADEIDTGLPLTASRAHGWHRLAVTAPTADECLARARDLTRVYHDQLRIQLAVPRAQTYLLREFIPGERPADTGHVRRMPVMTMAAAVPHVTGAIGDGRGDLIGYTNNAGDLPVMLDLHHPMERRDASGLNVLVAEPGGGKSTLMGALAYLNARRGVRCTLLDPSGPLANLCRMPELRPYSHVMDIANAAPGTLNPYALVPTPRRDQYPAGADGDLRFHRDHEQAQGERGELAADLCNMLLPPQFADNDQITQAIRQALRQIPLAETSQLDQVIDLLTARGEQDVPAATAAGLLADNRRWGLGQLFFGPAPDTTSASDAALTVITMAGLRLPDMTIGREHWSFEERLAVPILFAAHRLAARRCYSGDMNARKFIGLDEAHVLEQWGSGRSFQIRLARDSRKWNVAALLASQNPKDILSLDVQNLISRVFVGRIAEDPEIAIEALRLLRVQTGAGFEQTLAGLSQVGDDEDIRELACREFLMRDVNGRVQKICVDVGWVPGLLAALNTRPEAPR